MGRISLGLALWMRLRDALVVEPGVLKSLLSWGSFFGISGEQTPDEVLGLLGHHGVPVVVTASRTTVLMDIVLEVAQLIAVSLAVLALRDAINLSTGQVKLSSLCLFEDLLLVEAAERELALWKHLVGYDTQGPDVTLLVVGSVQDFGGQILWRTVDVTQLFCRTVVIQKTSWEAKVNDSQISEAVSHFVPRANVLIESVASTWPSFLDHNIRRLDVSVDDADVMHALYWVKQLTHDLLECTFIIKVTCQIKDFHVPIIKLFLSVLKLTLRFQVAILVSGIIASATLLTQLAAHELGQGVALAELHD